MEWLNSTITFIKDVNWAISLFAAIPLAVVANLLTPKVANWLGRRSGDKARKRVEELQTELNRTHSLSHDSESLNRETFITLFKVLAFIALGGAMGALGFIGFPIAAMFFLSAVLESMKHIKLLRRCENFREYENKTTDEIEQLDDKTSNN